MAADGGTTTAGGDKPPGEEPKQPGEAGKPVPRGPRRGTALKAVPLVAISIFVSVFFFILAAMFSPDAGLLGRMAQPTFARGLITYLFAVVTIGAAVAFFLIAGLTHEITEDFEVRFDRGKDILSLLLGVFGTIIGFYFGSAIGDTQSESAKGALTPPLIDSAVLASGQAETLKAFVSGGTPPYRFGTAFGKEDLSYDRSVDPSGWISTTITGPPQTTSTPLSMTLGVTTRPARP